ncbi:uncharacterized protein LOC121381526 [Gigantopelta aegis]|uniref:uncharacterized protein LOC121381526 n=1 Tax=Gigantopelta aegis TaxID=1735272 RepID=UPI001B887C6B|nr:uncharacterized protein LOC121381526 [Gigantopelta aegis]
MAEAARQVATLALLVSHHAVVTQVAVVALQQEEQERRQQHQTQRRRRRQTRQRSCWVRDWLPHGERLRHSHYYNLMESLRQRDPDRFKNFTRLEPALFDELLDRLRLRITKQNTSYRDAIEPGLKLAVTLRHLATGNSYVDLGYSFRVGDNSISLFLPEVCQAIIDEFLDEAVPAPMIKDEWKAIAEEFQRCWNVPHACGALDGKHVALKKPPHSGSEYFNYKGFFFIVVLALVDANYRFLWADVGGVGSQSDAQIYNASELAEVLQSGEINLPDDEHLPNDDRPHPYFMLSDDAFALKSYMMKPYSRRNMTYEEKIANCRISRGRLVVENAFGIMALRWQVLLTTMQQSTETVQLIVKTCMVLHNIMRTRYPGHHQALVDQEDANGNLIPGNWRRNANMHDMEQARGPTRESTKAKQKREYLKLYFNSPAGSVPWQDSMV